MVRPAYGIEQVFDLVAQFQSGWELEWVLDDLTEHGVLVLVVEWWKSNQHLVTDEAIST